MASITLRNLDVELKGCLRLEAAFHGRSMEDEARDSVRSSLDRDAARPGRHAASIRSRFAKLGGVDLPLEPRGPMHEPPSFDS